MEIKINLKLETDKLCFNHIVIYFKYYSFIIELHGELFNSNVHNEWKLKAKCSRHLQWLSLLCILKVSIAIYHSYDRTNLLS